MGDLYLCGLAGALRVGAPSAAARRLRGRHEVFNGGARDHLANRVQRQVIGGAKTNTRLAHVELLFGSLEPMSCYAQGRAGTLRDRAVYSHGLTSRHGIQ